MLIFDSASRLAATLLATVQTRIELAAVEIEEESLRYFSCLLLSLAAMFCLGMAIILGVLLIVVLYWETHRVAALLTLIVLFSLASTMLWLRLRSRYRNKPRLLAHTTGELSRDTEMLRPQSQP